MATFHASEFSMLQQTINSGLTHMCAKSDKMAKDVSMEIAASIISDTLLLEDDVDTAGENEQVVAALKALASSFPKASARSRAQLTYTNDVLNEINRDRATDPDFVKRITSAVASRLVANDFSTTPDTSALAEVLTEEASKAASGKDADIAMVSAPSTRSLICPISKLRMEDPVRNACKHVYSRAGIEMVFKAAESRSKQAVCPIAGCKKPVSRSTLVADQETKLMLEEDDERRAGGDSADS